MVETLVKVIEDPNVAKNDWNTWLQVLASGATNPVCCIGAILPRLFEMLFLGYADAVNNYPSRSRAMRDAGNTILLMYMHSQVPVPDLEQVVVHYGHVMPPTIFSVGCMTLGYHIYCPIDKIIPSLLLHELVHVSQFVNSAGRSVAQFGRIYLQQHCDAGYYEGIAWEREAYEREKVLYPAPDFANAPDAGCHPNPSAWMTYISNFSRCVDRTTGSMADGALACVCKNHQPFSGPFDPVCAWLDRFSRNCDQCTPPGRRLQEHLPVATSDPAGGRLQGLLKDGGSVRTRQLHSLVGGLPPGSPCKDYDPERVCAAAPETSSTAPLYGRYTMGLWNTCKEDWKQRTRTGTSTELSVAVCGCY